MTTLKLPVNNINNYFNYGVKFIYKDLGMTSLSRQEFWNSELKSPLMSKINSATIKELCFPHPSEEIYKTMSTFTWRGMEKNSY